MKLLAVGLLATLATFAHVPAANAAGPIQVAVAPASTTTTVASSVSVDITVANIAAPGLGAYVLKLAYDPAILRLDSLVDSGFVTNQGNIVFCQPAIIDNTAGTASEECSAIPLFGQPGVVAGDPVILANASFQPLAPGTSGISLAGTVLKRPNAAVLPATTSDGSVQVDAKPPPAPALPTPPTASVATQAAAETPDPSTPVADAARTSTAGGVATMANAAAATIISGALRPPSTGDGGGGGSHSRVIFAIAAGVVILAAALGAVWVRRQAEGR